MTAAVRPRRARPGRRPGTSLTREAILDSARRTFAAAGYERATIRAIAADAGVDPALVHHYFGSKDDLFAASIRLPLDVGRIVPGLVAGGPAGVGQRLVRLFLEVWDTHPERDVLLGVLRSAVSNDRAARLLTDFVAREVLTPVAAALRVPDAEVRAALVGSSLLGLAMGRYVLRLEPIAHLSADALASRVGPAVEHLLLGDASAAFS